MSFLKLEDKFSYLESSVSWTSFVKNLGVLLLYHLIIRNKQKEIKYPFNTGTKVLNIFMQTKTAPLIINPFSKNRCGI